LLLELVRVRIALFDACYTQSNINRLKYFRRLDGRKVTECTVFESATTKKLFFSNLDMKSANIEQANRDAGKRNLVVDQLHCHRQEIS